MGRWILHRACVQARKWQLSAPGHPLKLSVNVSTRQLHEPDFVDQVRDVLLKTGLRPDSLALEITESLLLGERETLVAQLEELKELGLQIAVDDFGTGYSSLSHLRHFPIDILRIDRSFVDGIDRDAGKAKLVRGIVNLGRACRSTSSPRESSSLSRPTSSAGCSSRLRRDSCSSRRCRRAGRAPAVRRRAAEPRAGPSAVYGVPFTTKG